MIWFVDIEKGRENCRVYVEERKLIRVAKESGMTKEDVIEGVARGELGAEGSSSEGVEHVGIERRGKEI